MTSQSFLIVVEVTLMDSILIVGAGPTGLVMALGLARRGVPVRIIDSKEGPARESRAMGLHARTLEFYRQFGFADEVVQNGVVADSVHFRAGERDVARFSLADMGKGISPYPFMLAYPQDQHERFLLDRLGRLGVAVQWGATLTDLHDHGDAVTVTVDDGTSAEQTRFAYVAGCDGAHSMVREALGIGFSGGSSEGLFYVADAAVSGAGGDEIFVGFREAGMALKIPVRSTGTQRLIGVVPPDLRIREPIGFEDLRAHIEHLLGVQVGEVNWFSTYQVHHRVADRFRRGRVFIAGDAGHIHSPAGGQGMNTGIGDAVNLSWKFAEVLHGRADQRLLDTYEAERSPFARSLIATTDRVFQFLVDNGKAAQVARVHVLPKVVATLAKFSRPRRLMFKTVSQTRISYRVCDFNRGRGGVVHGGDRLPWIVNAESDNFAPLQSLDWQLHVYGDASPALLETAQQLGLPIHRFPWNEKTREAGVGRDAAYLVRPDGYVALAADSADTSGELIEFVGRWGLAFGGPAQPRIEP